ncbi:MAG: hypothetical protein AB7S38_31990 [Vulcanimicrobiota bacterium]
MESPTLNRKAILELADVQAKTCVTLLMDTARSGPSARQGQIRFKNLVSQAEAELKARNLRQDEVAALLKPTEQLLIDTLFWSYQMEGLAIYLEGGTRRLYQLPFPVQDRVVVADQFYVKPLLKAATNENYYVLSLNLNGVQLLLCGAQGVSVFSLEATAKSLKEFMDATEISPELQHHGRAASRGAPTSSYHGHGGNEDLRKVALGEWMGSLARVVEGVLLEERLPLVLAGVEYVVGEYRTHDRYPHTVPEAVLGSPERKSPSELRQASWQRVKGLFEERLQQELGRFQAGAGTGRSICGLEECLQAAAEGRVEHLLVADGGRTEELSERACLDTLRNGGSVSVLSPEMVPGGGQIAAILRF